MFFLLSSKLLESNRYALMLLSVETLMSRMVELENSRASQTELVQSLQDFNSRLLQRLPAIENLYKQVSLMVNILPQGL